MTYKVTKPAPKPLPPTMISIEMTEREAELLYLFIGHFSPNEFKRIVNLSIKNHDSGVRPPSENAGEDDPCWPFFCALRDALDRSK